MIKELTMEKTSLLDGWKTMKLVDVCIVERGSSPRPIKKYITDDEGGVNWIKIGDTKNIEKYIYETNQKITKEGAEKSRFVEEGDFILSNSMSFGKPYILKTQGYIHDGWFKLKLHDFVDAEYFYQLLSSPLVNDQFHNLASGSVVKNISGDLVKKVELPIPPLTEQKQIVAILDKAFTAIDTAIANAEQNLKNAKELFESYLQNVFENKGDNWEEKRFDEICVLQRGFDLPTRLRKEGDYPLVSSNGITDYVDIWKVKSPGVSTGRSGTIGNVHYIEKDYFPLNTSLYIKEFHGNYERCIYYFLKQFDLSRFQSGAGVPTLNRNNVHPEKVYFPISKDEQKQIVKKLDELSDECKKLEAIYIQKIVDLEELKKSVLQKAFSGQLNTKI